MKSKCNDGKITPSKYEILMKQVYFLLKPILPKRVQIGLRRTYVFTKRSSYERVWPINEGAGASPPGWAGWPGGKRFSLVLTHDVETGIGQEKCLRLAEMEESRGLVSSFNFIAKQYRVSPECRETLKKKGFELGLHGLFHNGNPFRSREVFQKQAGEINKYLKEWGASGFRCPSMYHNLDWIGELDIEYDSSTFDTDPFEPQPDGVGTIFPLWVEGGPRPGGYLELPYTLPQDHTLFVIMREKDISIWKQKLDWIAQRGGMALLITHPDYMNFHKGKNHFNEYPARHYAEFLDYVKRRYDGQFWNPLPKQMVPFWKEYLRKTRGLSWPQADHPEVVPE